MIIGALESSGDIVSVSCCENEIFILKGDRDIIRLSNSPEGLASNCECYSTTTSNSTTNTAATATTTLTVLLKIPLLINIKQLQQPRDWPPAVGNITSVTATTTLTLALDLKYLC